MSTIFDKDQDHLSLLGALVAQHLPPHQITDEHWEKIIDLSLSQSMAHILYWVVKQSGMDIADNPLWQPLRQITLHTSARHLMLEYAVKQVDSALSVVGIRTLWLKGIVLARTVYPRPSLRPMSDLDVLIPYEQRELALNTVQSLGYQFNRDESHLLVSNDTLTRKLSHHYHLESSSANRIILEVHYRLVGNLDTLLPVERLDWFWSQTQAVQADEFAFSGLRPEAHLLYLAAHAILQHGEAETSLRQYFDIHQIVNTYTLDWDLLTKQASLLGWDYALERALRLAVKFFDTPVPPLVFMELQNKDAASENVIRSIHLRGKGGTWEKIRARLPLLSRKDRVRFLSRAIFPPSSYMRQRYAIASDRPVWPHYLYRWFHQAHGIGWWVWERLAMSLKGRHDNKS